MVVQPDNFVDAKSAYKLRDAVSKSFLYRRDARKAPVEDELGSCFDLLRTPVRPVAVGHRESQSCLGHIVDAIAEVRCVARRRLAALFGADARRDDATYSMLRQPYVESTSDQSAVAPLIEGRGGFDGNTLHCHYVS